MRVSDHRNRQHSHTLGRYPVVDRDECVRMIPEDIPAKDIRFAAGKTCHDRLQVTLNDLRLTRSKFRSFIETRCSPGFNDDELRRMFREQVGEISHY